MTVRVVICDDSQLMRELLSEALERQDGVRVVGTASDPYEAREVIKAANPDVVTLDVDMPRMDGLTFLDRIMRLRPTPVIMVSSHTERGADVTIRALERGAVDALPKPRNLSGDRFNAFARDLGARVRAAARATLTARRSAPSKTKVAAAKTAAQPSVARPRALIAVGASTGGVEALSGFLGAMPADAPPIMIVQHMPAAYVKRLAERLNERTSVTVEEAEAGAALSAGRCVIAPGDQHLSAVFDERGYQCRLSQGPRESGHRPSVDVLFHSIAEAAGADGVGVVLTGMGEDGARGLAAMRAAGAATFAQSQETAIVYGMPKAAVAMGGVQRQGAPDELAGWAVAAAAGDRRHEGGEHAQSA